MAAARDPSRGPNVVTGTSSKDRSSHKSRSKHGHTSRSSEHRSRGSSHGPASETADRISNGKITFQIGRSLGKGAYAEVLEAMNADSGETVALKRFEVKFVKNEALASMEQEIELMKRLNHPNIVKYFNAIRTKNHLYIALE